MKAFTLMVSLMLIGCGGNDNQSDDGNAAQPSVEFGAMTVKSDAADRVWQNMVACVNGDYLGEPGPTITIVDAVTIRRNDGRLSEYEYISGQIRIAAASLMLPITGLDHSGEALRLGMLDHLATTQAVDSIVAAFCVTRRPSPQTFPVVF